MERPVQPSGIQPPNSARCKVSMPGSPSSDAAAGDESLLDHRELVRDEYNPVSPSGARNSPPPSILQMNLPEASHWKDFWRTNSSTPHFSVDDTDQEASNSPSPKRLRLSSGATGMGAEPPAVEITGPSVAEEGLPVRGDFSHQQPSFDPLPLINAWYPNQPAIPSQLYYLEPESFAHQWLSPSAPFTVHHGIFYPPGHLDYLTHPSNNLASPDVSSGARGIQVPSTTVGSRIDSVSDPPAGPFRPASVVQDSPPTRSAVTRLSSSTVNTTAPSQPFHDLSSPTSIVSSGPLMAPFEDHFHSNQGARATFRHSQIETTVGAGPSSAHRSLGQHGFFLSHSQETEGSAELLRNEDAHGVLPLITDERALGPVSDAQSTYDVSRRCDVSHQQQSSDHLPPIDACFDSQAASPSLRPSGLGQPDSLDVSQVDAMPSFFVQGEAFNYKDNVEFGECMAVPRKVCNDMISNRKPRDLQVQSGGTRQGDLRGVPAQV